MKKTIHLVQCNDMYGTNVILPLALGVLWQTAISDPAISKKWKLGEVIYKKESIKDVAKKIAVGDLICFSNYVWNTEYHMSLAKEVKQINPNIFIVVGGPDVSPNKKNFWEKFKNMVDFAIVGEGESAITELLRCFPDLNEDSIPGAWTKNKFTGESQRIRDLPYHSSPYINGFYDDIVEKELAIGNSIQAVIQTNRGCPYRCTFCEEGREYKNKMFFYNEDRIKKELEWCATHKVEYLSIADDNWGITQQDVEYFRLIRDLKLKHGYPEVFDATFAKNAPDRLLQLADIDAEYDTKLIRGFTIALQSMNSDTLKSVKRFNLVPHKQLTLINGLKERNMPTYTEIIWPLPYEDYETLKQGLDRAIDIGLDNWMGLYPLTLQEGTELYEDFLQDFKLVRQQSYNSNKKEKQDVALTNIVNESTWVDRQTVIKGQLLYAWLMVLFFFGYTRPVIEELRKKKDITVCTIIDEFLTFINKSPNLQIYKFHKNIEHWWSAWYDGDATPEISLFPDKDTSNWMANAHLASYIQDNFDNFYSEFELFLKHQYPTITCSQALTESKHSIVRYGKSYPYQFDNFTVNVANLVPEFDSLYEFSRYYYWWKRKTGWHRTVLEKTS